MKRLLSLLLTISMCVSLSACGKSEPQKEYYQNTGIENLETFSSVTGIELNVAEEAPESNYVIYNYLMDNDANGVGAVLKYESYLKEFGFTEDEELLVEDGTVYTMGDYILVAGSFTPQSNILQYVLTIPTKKAGGTEKLDNQQKEPQTEPEKDDETIYQEFCQLVDDGQYTEALNTRKREKRLSLDYKDAKDYYNYATAMQLYKETEFLTFQDISKMVQLLNEDISEGFKDSAEIAEKVNRLCSTDTSKHG